MYRQWRHWLPEIVIAAAAVFFAYRELGTFPGAWLDEGLFIMTARNVAEGRGYAIDLLGSFWHFPYFLAIGPTVILPVAASLKIFGVSVVAARLPMTLYLLATIGAAYLFTRKIDDRSSARWTTALLVSLSAFVNTGKPVLGEVPALFFLLLGLLAFDRIKNPWKRGIVAGVLMGLSILTKITFALVLPALAVAVLFTFFRRRYRDSLAAIIAGITAGMICVPWRILEIANTPAGSLTDEISRSVFGGGEIPMMFVLRETPELLLRLPFLAYALFFALGCAGIWRTRAKSETRVIIAATVTLFTLYFLNSYGWYRHLLPAHVLLLPFVPAGVLRIFRRRIGSIVLLAIVLLQGAWQLSHRGAGQGTALRETIREMEAEYAGRNVLIEQAEVFAQLSRNAHWLYLIRDGVSPTMPEEFMTPPPSMRCYWHLRKLNEQEKQEYGGTAVEVGNAFLLPPPPGCK